MITFQPRWVFEGMTGDSKIGKHVQKVVRDRLKTYDDVSAHPELGWYGQQENREWKQYFLHDDNNHTTGQCPFKLKRSEQHGRKKSLPVQQVHDGVTRFRAIAGRFRQIHPKV